MSSRRAQLIACLEKGLHYFSIGQFSEARTYWEKALEIDPNNAQAREFMQYVADELNAAPAAPAAPPSPPAGMGWESQGPATQNQAPQTPGTTPVRDLSTRHMGAQEAANINAGLGHHQEQLSHAPAAQHSFLAPSSHNIEDLLVPTGNADASGLPYQGMNANIGSAGLMPPSLGNFAQLNDEMSLFDQSGSHPLFGEADPGANHPLFDTGPAAQAPSTPEPPAPTAETPDDEEPQHETYAQSAGRDLSTRFLPILQNKPQTVSEFVPNNEDEPPTQRKNPRSTLPPATSLKVKNVNALAPPDALATNDSLAAAATDEPPRRERKPRATLPPNANIKIDNIEELAPSNPIPPTNNADVEESTHKTKPPTMDIHVDAAASMRHTTKLPIQASPQKLSPVQISQLIDNEEAALDAQLDALEQSAPQETKPTDLSTNEFAQRLEEIDDILDSLGELDGLPAEPEADIPLDETYASHSTNETQAAPSAPEQTIGLTPAPETRPPDFAPNQANHRVPLTPPPISLDLPPEEPEAQDTISAHIDAFEDTPSDEFPAANEPLLDAAAEDGPTTTGFIDFPFDEEDGEAMHLHIDDDNIIESNEMAAPDHMTDSPTPPSELPSAEGVGGYQDSYSLEGSQLEFTGLPEIPDPQPQEAGQVISFDLQGTDEPYIQDKQNSPILTFRSQPPIEQNQYAPPYQQGTATNAPYQPPVEQFAQRDPFDQPFDDPFAETNNPDHNPYAGAEQNDPYGATNATSTQTPAYDEYGYEQQSYGSTQQAEAYQSYDQNSDASYQYEQHGSNASYDQHNNYAQQDYNYQNQNQYEQHGSNASYDQHVGGHGTDQYDPYAQTANPYGATGDLYDGGSAPYNQTADPYNQTMDPYAQQPDPYSQTPDPSYSQTPDPSYGQTVDPYNQTMDPYAQQPDPYSQTPDPSYSQTPDPYSQTPDPSYSPNAHQETADFGAFQEDFGILELDQEFADHGSVEFEDEPTPDAPMPSIHEQLAHLPSAALRHDYVEHKPSRPAPAPTPPPAEQDEVDILLTGAKDLLAEEDYRSAMELIEMAKTQNPDHPDVQILYEACQAEVEKINLSEITSLDLVPHVKCSMEEIMQLNIDHRVGFLISQIDGNTSLSDLMILTGFNETELINAIGQLKHQKVIHLE